MEMPVENGKFWAGLWSQTGWGDSTNWQAANSRQMVQRNWKNGHQQIWDSVLGFSKASRLRIYWPKFGKGALWWQTETDDAFPSSFLLQLVFQQSAEWFDAHVVKSIDHQTLLCHTVLNSLGPASYFPWLSQETISGTKEQMPTQLTFKIGKYTFH